MEREQAVRGDELVEMEEGENQEILLGPLCQRLRGRCGVWIPPETLGNINEDAMSSGLVCGSVIG